MAVQKAKRRKSLLRLALTGPTNSGKTYSALRLAHGIVKANFPEATEDQIWEKVCVIDTERDRALFYAERTDLPMPTGQFNYISIEAPYTPEKYIAAVADASAVVGPEGCVIIDSLTHAWAYSGGILDMHKNSVSKGKNSFTSWNEYGAIQNNLIDTILTVKTNLIATMRSKMDYVLEPNAEGKMQPVKKGLKPVQRDDTEYEFDVTLMLDNNHMPTIVKDTTFLNAVGLDEPITEQLGEQLITWLKQGIDPKEFEKAKIENLTKEIKSLGKQHPALKNMFDTLHPNWNINELTLAQAKTVLEEFNNALT